MIWLLVSLMALAVMAVLFWPLRKNGWVWTAPLAAGAAVIVYAWVGAPSLLPVIAVRNAEMREIDMRIAELEAQPETLTTLAQRGQAYMERGRYADSVAAYKRAVLMSEGNPLLILQLSKAVIFREDGQVTEEARKGLRLVRAMLPGNAEAQYFLALADAQDGNAEKAMPVFKKLFHELPKDSPIRQIIARQIGRE